MSDKKIISFILQGKGGCGKSFIATIFTQYVQNSLNKRVSGYDLDQINPTFSEFKELPVKHYSVIDSVSNKFNSRQFDTVIESIIIDKSDYIIIDTGSNTFMQLLEYAAEINLFQTLEEMGFDIYLHLILCGGDLYKTTLIGVESVIEQFKSPCIIWLNEHFGPLTNIKDEKIFQSNYTHINKFKGTVRLVQRDEKTFGEDIRNINEDRIILNSALKKYGLMTQIRLKKIFGDCFSQLDMIYKKDSAINE
ncbi:hypothetical protein [Xenorhabdus nematophila]|uniref:hypothetical protein n=1 Tax=Xenorhabdus nematophila TaxID=628 RepID=UPI003D6F7A51